MSIDEQLFKTGIEYKEPQRPKAMLGWQGIAKLVLDKTLSLLLLIQLMPLLLFVSLVIKIDSKGPVIFKQKRHGLDNKEFWIWKFRTMTVMENGSSFKQAEKNDVRITRIGNFLRKTSIDELPQLVNVLLGDMSIVGPRPHPVALNDKFAPLIASYNYRHDVKPGLTGWAQIKGHRGPTETLQQMQDRVKHDISYIANWTIWSDIKIIILTPYYGLFSKNAF